MPPDANQDDETMRCSNCGAPVSRRATGMLSPSVGTTCPECGEHI